MQRRNHRKAKKGQVYASEWPEWHVECALAGCEAHALVAAQGMALTVVQAEKALRNNDEQQCAGWKKIKGLWYCPKHSQQENKS